MDTDENKKMQIEQNLIHEKLMKRYGHKVYIFVCALVETISLSEEQRPL